MCRYHRHLSKQKDFSDLIKMCPIAICNNLNKCKNRSYILNKDFTDCLVLEEEHYGGYLKYLIIGFVDSNQFSLYKMIDNQKDVFLNNVPWKSLMDYFGDDITQDVNITFRY